MKLINKDNISHIIALDVQKGAWSGWGYFIQLTYVPYRKHKWWEFDKETKEGYYENGYAGLSNAYISAEEVKNSKKYFVSDSSIYTYPQISLYLGKDLIHKEYFQNYKELQKHLKENYPEINIIYK